MRMSAGVRTYRSLTSRAQTIAISPPSARALAVLVLVLLVGIVAPAATTNQWFTDLDAFYCAGATIAAGQDPYRAEPLATCELRPKPANFHVVAPNVSLPAPLPPYALALFVPLSFLPYVAAAVVWSLLLLLALGVAVEALHRLSALPRAPLFAVLTPIDGYSSIYLGETVPIVVAALSLAALAVARGRAERAALSLAPAMIAPHVGLPAALALFLWRPAARVPLVAIGIAFALLSVVCVGPATAFEYVRDVLPAHALSEVANNQQFSLTGFLHMFGVPDALALRLGSLSYIVMLLTGVALARMLARRDGRDPLIVALPAALAVTGGVFLHATQLPAALPAALIAFVRTHGTTRRSIGIAILLLALPLDQAFLGAVFVPLAAGAAYLIVRDLLLGGGRASVLAALAAGGAVVAVDLALGFATPVPPMHLPPLHPHDLAEVSWALGTRAFSSWGTRVFDFARIPSWLGITTLAACLARTVLRGPRYRIVSESPNAAPAPTREPALR